MRHNVWQSSAVQFIITVDFVIDNFCLHQEAVNLKKKEQEKLASTKGMTKGQKRRFYDKFGNIDADDKPRGWDWVDVIKHLSKTGTAN